VNTLWHHQTQHNGAVQLVLGVYHNDIVHYLSLNGQGQPMSYEIIKHPNSLNQGVTWVDLHGNFQFLPKAFSEAPLPGFHPCTKRNINHTTTLAFQPSVLQQPLVTETAQYHIAEGLFSIANTYANHKECVSVLWFHEQTAIVFAYRHGDLIFANRFPSSNTQEHLYYALLPFHEDKLTPQQLGLYVLCDELQQNAAAPLFQKFIPQAEITSPPLPWISQTPAPMMHIVTPLIKLATCVSREEI
jgi:hypothetical protein